MPSDLFLHSHVFHSLNSVCFCLNLSVPHFSASLSLSCLFSFSHTTVTHERRVMQLKAKRRRLATHFHWFNVGLAMVQAIRPPLSGHEKRGRESKGGKVRCGEKVYGKSVRRSQSRGKEWEKRYGKGRVAFSTILYISFLLTVDCILYCIYTLLFTPLLPCQRVNGARERKWVTGSAAICVTSNGVLSSRAGHYCCISLRERESCRSRSLLLLYFHSLSIFCLSRFSRKTLSHTLHTLFSQDPDETPAVDVSFSIASLFFFTIMSSYVNSSFSSVSSHLTRNVFSHGGERGRGREEERNCQGREVNVKREDRNHSVD